MEALPPEAPRPARCRLLPAHYLCHGVSPSSNGHCVNKGVQLEDKANVSILIGEASPGFPDSVSWLGTLEPTDNGCYSQRSFWGQISRSGFQAGLRNLNYE